MLHQQDTECLRSFAHFSGKKLQNLEDYVSSLHFCVPIFIGKQTFEHGKLFGAKHEFSISCFVIPKQISKKLAKENANEPVFNANPEDSVTVIRERRLQFPKLMTVFHSYQVS